MLNPMKYEPEVSNIQKKVVEISRSLVDLPVSRFKHFSFICERNKIVSFGYNRNRVTHPTAKRFGHRFSCIHSELDAIRNFPYPLSYLKRYTFINVRIYRDGSLGLARPCIHCQHMLFSFGVKQVIYSIPSGFKELQLC
jgi:hypothetical protein